ncbi:MAG: Uma2 family endonuclease [Saprospiraceae bacterium]
MIKYTQPILYKDRKDVITNPLLIVEVLSKATAEYDRSIKFDYYRSLPSFQEYVLLSQSKPRASVYHREGENTWHIEDVRSGMIQLKSVDCQIDIAAIYEDITFEPEDIKA